MAYPVNGSQKKNPGKYFPIALIVLGVVSLLAFTACSNSPDPESAEHQDSRASFENSSNPASTENGEESATQFTPGDTFDDVRAGARLILTYNSTTNAFNGTVENTTDDTLPNVRVEVHLSNGIELGPTTPVNLAPGQAVDVVLPATEQPFATWNAHPEVGGNSESGEHSSSSEAGEHERGSESGEQRGGSGSGEQRGGSGSGEHRGG